MQKKKKKPSPSYLLHFGLLAELVLNLLHVSTPPEHTAGEVLLYSPNLQSELQRRGITD
jgi:hypothetical protein